MRYDAAPCPLLVWLAAAALGWAVLLGVVLYLPEALVGVAVAGLLLWRRGRQPVALTVPGDTTPAPVARNRDDVRHLVAHSV